MKKMTNRDIEIINGIADLKELNTQLKELKWWQYIQKKEIKATIDAIKFIYKLNKPNDELRKIYTNAKRNGNGTT